MNPIKIRNKNVILELLQAGIKFEKIAMADNLKPDELTKQIVETARKNKIWVDRLPRHKMDFGRGGENREVLLGLLAPPLDWTLANLITDLYAKKQLPFFLLMNRVTYQNNIGAIARTAFAAGVNGLIYQGEIEQFCNEETIHFSLGTLARIPLVKMNIFTALTELHKNNIRTLALEMKGTNYFQQDLKGAVAFVLGAEGVGVSDTISHKCDGAISIPMVAGIDSLNVSASAAVVIYEKVRQSGGIIAQ